MSGKYVRNCVAAVASDGDSARLAVYWSATPESVGDADSLRDYMQRLLPAYMVPSDFIRVDRLPTTAHGKIDMAALAALLPAESARVSSGTSNGVEDLIAQAWRAELRREAIGTSENFFELGAHSMMVIRVHNRLTPLLGARLRVIDFFRYPTVAALARYVSEGFLGRIDETDGIASPAGEAPAAARRQRRARRLAGR